MEETMSATISYEDSIETLKNMLFGEQAFVRFNADERDALNYAIEHLMVVTI